MPLTVEYCLSSCETDLASTVDTDGVALRERRCLEQCGICRNRAFVLVDGQLVVEPELTSTLESLADVETGGDR